MDKKLKTGDTRLRVTFDLPIDAKEFDFTDFLKLHREKEREIIDKLIDNFKGFENATVLKYVVRESHSRTLERFQGNHTVYNSRNVLQPWEEKQDKDKNVGEN